MQQPGLGSSEGEDLGETTDRATSWRFRDYADLALMTATHGLSDGFANLMVPVLALIVLELNLTTFEAGLILSARSVATFLVLYPVSMLADSLGRKKEILIAGLAISTMAYLSMGLTGTLSGIVALSFAAGMGNAVYHPCGTALVARRFAGRRAVAISFHGLGGNIGTSLMPLLQSAVVALSGWRAAIGASVMPAAVLLPLIGLRFSSSGDTNAPPAGHVPVRGIGALTGQVLRNRTVVLLALVQIAKGMGSKGIIGFLPLLAASKFSMDTPAIGLAVSAYFSTGIVSKPFMGFLYDRWGSRTALFVPLSLTCLLALALALTPWRETIIPLAALIGVFSAISPIILTAAADSCEEDSLASSVGFIYTCEGLGFLAPLIGGWLAGLTSLSTSYLLFGLAVAVGAGVSTRLPRTSSVSPVS